MLEKFPSYNQPLTLRLEHKIFEIYDMNGQIDCRSKPKLVISRWR